MHFITFYFSLFCLPLQFGALLKLFWDPKLNLSKATQRQSKAAAGESKQKALPARSCVCSVEWPAWKQRCAFNRNHGCTWLPGRILFSLQCQIWRLKINSQQCLFGQTVSVLQTHHTCLFPFSFETPRQDTPASTRGLGQQRCALANVGMEVAKLLSPYECQLMSQLPGNLECY